MDIQVVPVEIVTAAMKRVKEIYEIEKKLAIEEKREPDFHKVLYEVVNDHRHLSQGEKKYMRSAIGRFFAQRGGLAPHKERRRGFMKWVTLQPRELNWQDKIDMCNTARQAHEHICPID